MPVDCITVFLSTNWAADYGQWSVYSNRQAEEGQRTVGQRTVDRGCEDQGQDQGKDQADQCGVRWDARKGLPACLPACYPASWATCLPVGINGVNTFTVHAASTAACMHQLYYPVV